jgi:hypothetical protein
VCNLINVKNIKDNFIYKIEIDECIYLFSGKEIKNLFLKNSLQKYFYEKNLPNEFLKLPGFMAIGEKDGCVRDAKIYCKKFPMKSYLLKNADHIFSGKEKELAKLIFDNIF